MLAFVHTARGHVANFERLVREQDDKIAVRHVVHEHLLQDVISAGGVTPAVQASIAELVQTLAKEGARVIVPTCSSINEAAEAVVVPGRAVVMRIDRAMAEQAVESGRRVVVMAALRSTVSPTVALLRKCASRVARSVEIVEVVCEPAWRLFENGQHDAYARCIADSIEQTVGPDDVVVLAQASMAAAADLVHHLRVPVLSSPRLGVQAALLTCGEQMAGD